MSAPLSAENGHWQDQSFSKKIKQIFENGYLADCIFIVGPEKETAEKIYGHKFMFIIESPVMEAMFTGSFAEAKDKAEIYIPDCHPKDFKNFRYMIYSNHLSNLSKFSLEDTFELYHLCDKYMVSSVSKHCISHMITLVNSPQKLDTLLTMYDFACEVKDKSLKAAIEDKIRMRPDKIHAKINDLSQNAFSEFIKFFSSLKYSSSTTGLTGFANQNKTVPATIGSPISRPIIVTREPIPFAPLHQQQQLQQLQHRQQQQQHQSKIISDLIIFQVIDVYFIQNNLHSDEKLSETDIKQPPAVKLKEKVNKNHILLNKLLEFVNFNKMTPVEFINGPGKSILLDTNKKYEILSSICLSKNCNGYEIPIYGL